MRTFSIFLILIALGFTSCASSKSGPGAKKARYDRNFIAYEDIIANPATNAYDLIRSLRIHWLQGRGTKSFRNPGASLPMVYVNNSRHGNIETLSSVSTTNIKSIKFLNASDATIRFGLNHTGGAILITIE